MKIWKYAGKLKRYLIPVLLPLICGVILFTTVFNITRNQINEYGELTTQYFKSEVAAMFAEAESACNYLLEDHYFKTCMSAETAWNFDRKLFREGIQKYTNRSNYISEIFIYNENQQMIYSSRAYYEFSPYTVIIKSADISSIIHENTTTGWHVLNSDDAVPYYIARVPMDDGRKDIFVIATIEMYPLLQFMHSIDAKGCALYNAEGYITPLITTQTNINWTDEQAIGQLLGTHVECFYAEENDYTYVVAVAQEKYNTPLRLIAVVFGLYFIVVVLAGVIYLYTIASRDRKRMSAIVDYLPTENAENTSEEELFFNIRKSLRQYQNDKRKFDDENRSSSVRQILKRGQNKSIHESKYRAAGIPTDAAGYCVVSLFTDDYSDMFFDDGDELQNIDIARIIFRTAFDEIAAEQRVCISGTGLGRIYASVFSFMDTNDPAKLAQSVVRETVDFIEKNYGLNICAVISDFIEDPGKIHEAYQETERLKDYIKVVGIDSGIVSKQNLTDTTEDAFDGNYVTQLQILTNAIHAEKFDIIPQMVEQILSQYVTALRKHYHIVQSRVTTMSGLLSEAVLSCKLPGVDLISLSSRFRDAQTVAEINSAAQEIFPLLNCRAEETMEEDPVNRACEYIRANSNDANLSMPAISEYCGVSLRHLTRLFQKKLGCTVAAYLNSYRIACSKTLLAETNLPVSTIAQKVGYNSTNTFVYNFRQCEGITPTNYREITLRNDNENL